MIKRSSDKHIVSPTNAQPNNPPKPERPRKSRPRPVILSRTPEEKRLSDRAIAVRERKLKKQLEAGLSAKKQVDAPPVAPSGILWIRDSSGAMPDKTLRINVPTGIGDFSWIYSKLLTLDIPMDVVVAKGHPARLVPIGELLPSIRRMSMSSESYDRLDKIKISPMTSKKTLMEWPLNKEIPISANRHLEQGNRIESWLPELEMVHHYPIDIPQAHIETFKSLIPYSDYVCIFAANKKTCQAWDGWMAPQWCEFMKLYRHRIADLPFVIIGAPWDVGLASEIIEAAGAESIPVLDMTGRTVLGVSFQIIKSSKYFVSFPSGMGIFGHVMKHPTTMFYPNCLQLMIGTYDSPEARETNRFHETPFCSPTELIDWLISVYGIKNRA